jgi:uncharacterized protein YbcI
MTISEMRADLVKHLSKDGIARRTDTEKKPTTSQTGEEATKTSRITFVKDLAAQRDREIIKEVIQEIMTNRRVSREEAERILNNPF